MVSRLNGLRQVASWFSSPLCVPGNRAAGDDWAGSGLFVCRIKNKFARGAEVGTGASGRICPRRSASPQHLALLLAPLPWSYYSHPSPLIHVPLRRIVQIVLKRQHILSLTMQIIVL
jgi:hypothetical protein